MGGKQSGIWTLIAVIGLALGGCYANFPPAPAVIESFEPQYLIGPGDSVNMTVAVRPDGKITTPLVEDLPASGRTPTQLAREIEKSLSKYVQSPVVTVIVAGGIGPYSEQIRVLGEAAKPQALPYRENMSLLDVMITVGGITDYAAGNRASILRTVGGKKEQFGVRLWDLLKGGDLTANVAMRPGDVLIIPQSYF
jgi:polysaccharide export outer membrane protein